jgi:hypothetical protein
MSSSINKSRSSTPLSNSLPLNGTSQLKKILASPKKEQSLDPLPLTGKPFHLSPPVMDSTPNDPDDFMNQLSQNTVSFHASTHSGGRPLSPSSQQLQRYTATPSPVEDPVKTRALAQVLSLSAASSSSSAILSSTTSKKSSSSAPTVTTSTSSLTGIAITQQMHGSKKTGTTAPSLSSSSVDTFLTDKEISARNLAIATAAPVAGGGARKPTPHLLHPLSSPPPHSTMRGIDPLALLAPSDLTGCKYSFPS